MRRIESQFRAQVSHAYRWIHILVRFLALRINLVSSNKNVSPTNVNTHVIITTLNLYRSFEIGVFIVFESQIIWKIL